MGDQAKQKQLTLGEYNNEVADHHVTYLWIVSLAHPAGAEYRHDPEDEGEYYCDVPELIEQFGFWGLTGTIDEHGEWSWDGEGKPRDHRGNSIRAIKAGFDGA